MICVALHAEMIFFDLLDNQQGCWSDASLLVELVMMELLLRIASLLDLLKSPQMVSGINLKTSKCTNDRKSN